MEMELLMVIKLFILLLLSSPYPLVTSLQHNNFTDLRSLLAFKNHVVDPQQILSVSWTTNTSFCNWIGVSCSRRHQRVTAIELPSFALSGTIPPQISNLSFLSRLDLSNNSFSGTIPESLCFLSRLSSFFLNRNQLSGSVPPNFFNMSSLKLVYFGRNNLSGPLLVKNDTFDVPPQIQELSVSYNQFAGKVPLGISRFRNLQILDLAYNEFSGNVPGWLGDLPELIVLYLGANQFNGKIPISLGNLTQLLDLAIGQNNLEGTIPDELGNLLNLQLLNLATNGLTGTIPMSILNASMLNSLSLYDNKLTGPLPDALGKFMPQLAELRLAQNQLSGGLEFITSLTNCKNLRFIDISENYIGGFLPDSVGNLSHNLQYLHTEQNRMQGKIPAGLGNLSGLIFLTLDKNELIGSIPSEITELQNLQVMYMDLNRITGPIPFELGQMISLNVLSLPENLLSGRIPDSIGNLSKLQHLSLAGNKLSSNIPQAFWSLDGLIELNLSQNTLEGGITHEVQNLNALDKFDVSKNRFSGNISSKLGELHMLSHLDFSSNDFHGQIPESLGGLININYINISYNSLSGAIPESLANLRHLNILDLSFNKLSGKIPGGRVFSNISIPILEGNLALCGSPRLGFSQCSTNTSTSSNKNLHLLRIILPVIGFVLLLLACLYFLIRFWKRRLVQPLTNDDIKWPNHRLISYHELVTATDNFSDANLLGTGSFGSVFRAQLNDGLLVAVKVLNLDVHGASRSFDAECRTLSTVRHRNLLRIISTCSNLDFKALVLQFMSNGSLEKWLYSEDYYLNLLQRINIMMDVAHAIEYLHHHHPHVIVHCDIKPSNVLLDENMIAHVSDFGISKLMIDDSRFAGSTSTRGTIGYMAPEYGSTGKVSRRGDVYSFGILLLETFTRKKPTNSMFTGELSLRKWVSDAFPSALLEIVDSTLMNDDSITNTQSAVFTAINQCLASIIQLGLLCSVDLPKERISMKDVVSQLQKIMVEFSPFSYNAARP